MKNWVIASVVAGIVAVGGVGAHANSPDTVNTVAAQSSQVVNVKQASQTGAKLLSAEEAKTIALKKANGTVTKVELDTDDGRKHYDIEIKDGTYEYDFEIDAVTGQIIESKKEFDDDRKKITASTQANTTQKSNQKQGMLSQDEAVAIAMKQATGTVTDVELDDEDGQTVYEIEIKDGTFEYDFDIDAVTGKVLKFKKDRDDD